MSDTDIQTQSSLKDQISDAGEEAKQRASKVFRSSAETAQNKLNEASQAAMDVAADTAEKVQDQARKQQHVGADYVEKFAANMRDAARAFEGDAPFAARGLTSAAEYVEEAGQTLRDRSMGDLIDAAGQFAKRQPAAFLGISVLAGFAIVRFLKASGAPSSSPDIAS
jgi:ABC-type transporter Mla subunit MlaD